ncbi:MAG: hypothetical protein ACKVVP_17880 [Chloroflexota bacterium]
MSEAVFALAVLLPLAAAPLVMLTQTVASGHGQLISVIWTSLLMALLFGSMLLGLATLFVPLEPTI